MCSRGNNVTINIRLILSFGVRAVKTLIVYAGRHGCTQKCAEMLAARAPGGITLANLQKCQADPSGYDTVIIGGSIRMGKIQKETATFCRAYLSQLLEKKVGLFLCCANAAAVAAQLQAAFTAELLAAARAVEHLGYAYYFQKMNFLERAVVKKIAGVSRTVENISQAGVDRLCAALYGEQSAG